MNRRFALAFPFIALVLLASTNAVARGNAAHSSTRVPATAARAARFGHRHHLTTGIAVLDTRTGALYTAGRSSRRFPSASVVKTMIATRLLLAGRMHGAVARRARAMIERSDNSAAAELYPLVGRDRLLPWLAAHYGIHGLGGRPTMRGVWGSTQITARGLVRFYGAVRGDPRVWPWLSRAMHAYRPLSSAGEPNAFGLAAATRHAAVKNGWDVDRDVLAPSNAIINTTGFVNRDRYAVAILGEGPGRLYYRAGESLVTRVARILLPHGRITPVPPPTVTALSTTSCHQRGDVTVTVRGTGFSAARSVWFGSRRGRDITVLSPRRLTVTAPAHVAGTVHLRITSTYGTSRPTKDDRFTYRRPSGK